MKSTDSRQSFCDKFVNFSAVSSLTAADDLPRLNTPKHFVTVKYAAADFLMSKCYQSKSLVAPVL